MRRNTPIAWMARNPVAANLLAITLLLGGAAGLWRVNTEVFPEFDLDMITVRVPYPGAGPEEVEQGIILAVEEALSSQEWVKHINSTATEGMAMVNAELIDGVDADQALSDAKSAIARITSFPEEAEEPSVTLASQRHEVISLVVSGQVPLSTLDHLAERIRSDLLDLEQITQVDIQGVRSREVEIHVSREMLLAYGLSFGEVARQVRLGSPDLPGIS